MGGGKDSHGIGKVFRIGYTVHPCVRLGRKPLREVADSRLYCISIGFESRVNNVHIVSPMFDIVLLGLFGLVQIVVFRIIHNSS